MKLSRDVFESDIAAVQAYHMCTLSARARGRVDPDMLASYTAACIQLRRAEMRLNETVHAACILLSFST